MFHIIGVAHRAQILKLGIKPNEDQKLLFRCLSGLVREIEPTVIAEEQSLESLCKDFSIPRGIARAKIEHRFCDPDSKQRAAMHYRTSTEISQEIFFSAEGWALSNSEINAKARAIEIVRYFPLRERFWLEQLADRLDTEVAFVCGDAHIEGSWGYSIKREFFPVL